VRHVVHLPRITAYLLTERKCEVLKHTVLTSFCAKGVKNIWVP